MGIRNTSWITPPRKHETNPTVVIRIEISPRFQQIQREISVSNHSWIHISLKLLKIFLIYSSLPDSYKLLRCWSAGVLLVSRNAINNHSSALVRILMSRTIHLFSFKLGIHFQIVKPCLSLDSFGFLWCRWMLERGTQQMTQCHGKVNIGPNFWYHELFLNFRPKASNF